MSGHERRDAGVYPVIPVNPVSYVVDVSDNEGQELIEIIDSDSDILFSDDSSTHEHELDTILRPANPVPQIREEDLLDRLENVPTLPSIPNALLRTLLSESENSGLRPASLMATNSIPGDLHITPSVFTSLPTAPVPLVQENVNLAVTPSTSSAGNPNPALHVNTDNVLHSQSTSDYNVDSISRTDLQTSGAIATTINDPLVSVLTPILGPLPILFQSPPRPTITSPVGSPQHPREVRILVDQNQSFKEFRSPKRRKLMSPVKDDSDDDGDTCPVCFELWTTSGNHRLISLKCGHLFGQSCIQKWLKGQGGKCPQCNAKARRQDIRVLYAKGIRALDTSERDRALQDLVEERDAKKKMELESAQLRLKYSLSVEECNVLRNEQDRLRRELALLRSQSSNTSMSLSQPSTSTSIQRVCTGVFIQDKTINISDAGKCRVLAYSSSLAALLVSQPSSHALFKGFGVKKISTMDFKTSQFLTIHSKVIRDICFHPVYDDGILLSCGMDKAIKMTSIMSNAVVQTYEAAMPVWSCVWNTTNKSYFYAGLQNGTVLEYDVRNTSEAVQELNKEACKSPVVSLQYIPKDVSAAFKQEGLLVGQLNCTSFYEKKTESEMKLHLLPFDGTLTSLSFESSTRQLLASFRPTTKYPYVRHQLCRMTLYNDLDGSQSADDICSSTLIHSFKGCKTQSILSRSTLFPTGDESSRLIVCGSDETSSMVHTWDGTSGQPLQRISCGGVPVDITPINNQYLAALTEKHLKIFKWQ